ncbi:MAG TPA: L-rhamnose mutarotase [Acidobacteriaceae bacterium]|nr:L-rhamnose mutarotase [Acidobacteriaceae bacterium]
MRRYCQLIRLLPEHRVEYIEYHRRVWPTVLATIDACNIRNYSIFLYNDLLVAYFEYYGDDYEADMRKMAADPETQRWWKITDAMQEVLPEAGPGDKWLQIPEVFHFEGSPTGGNA